MPIEFEVPEPWNDRGWKVKIQDKERLEPPHVTILFRTWKWRFGLREQDFLDRDPDPRQVPPEIVEHLRGHWSDYVSAWDRLYPRNPVDSREG